MNIQSLFDPASATQMLDERIQSDVAAQLGTLTNTQVYARSIAGVGNSIYFLVRTPEGKRLALLSKSTAGMNLPTKPQWSEYPLAGESLHLAFLPMDGMAAAWMRQQFAWLQPTTLGLAKSVGCGDRLGLATPGHLRAVRACSSGIRPILAQQSIREMTRTQRSAQQVVDDAMWGVFQEGWRTGYGADADHLKTFEDIDKCVAAGFTFYTFDPGAFVDNDNQPSKFDALPWQELETTAADTRARYGSRFDAETLQKSFVKYGRAIAQVTRLCRYLKTAMQGHPYEVEVSVDETDQPTTYAEHFIVASELRRLGVEWVSLAPRFIGRFEKGVDYIGDLQAFEKECAAHVKVIQELGPYKLSIHSGSDKFSIYPIVSRLAGDLVHLKTAGTSYLEALRSVARCDPDLFRNVYAMAHVRYGVDRASYHVSAEPTRAPKVSLAGVTDLQAVLDQFDAREMLHVCFGSILGKYGTEIKTVLDQNEETHYADLERHFKRHLASFC
jgi:hypothetical protein